MADRTEESLIEGIAPKKVEHEAPFEEKEFKAWHKPRKQWVRKEQWLKETESLISRLQLAERPLLRYLSLPGEDMLDVRILANFCKEKGLSLKCLAYDEGARSRTSRTEINISWNEVSNNIVATSTLLSDNIAVLKNVRSQAFSYVPEHGPFDIINLDLCGSVSCINYPDNHQVLKNLCEYQANHSREPWLLFLTTRAEYEKVNIEDLPHYLKNLKVNAEDSRRFGDRLAEITGFDIHGCDWDVDPTVLFGECTGKAFVKLFAAGFGKWLLRLMSGGQNAWEVEMLDSCWYRVENNQTPKSFPNMLSLAFRLSPISVRLLDPSGLTTSNPEAEVDEKNLAMGILETTERFIDLDLKIDRDASLYNNLVEGSASLLKAARYSVEGYAEWAEEKRIRFGPN